MNLCYYNIEITRKHILNFINKQNIQGGPDVTEPESSVDDHWFQVCFSKYASNRHQGSVTSGQPCIKK